jgi:hypothetical protein
MISKIGASFGMVRYASSTTARIFASSLNAGKMTDSDFMTARKVVDYQNRGDGCKRKKIERVLQRESFLAGDDELRANR